MNSNRLLSICSSRSNPVRLRHMLSSWQETRTKGFSKMLVHIWEEDPKVEDYKKVAEEFKSDDIEFVFGKKMFMVEVMNHYSKLYEYDFYQMINDDHYYVKEGWDKSMTEPIDKNHGWGISYTEGEANRHNPNAEIVSGKVVRALGYYVYPKFRQAGIEAYFISLGKVVGFFFIENTIHHRSINSGWGLVDGEWKHIGGMGAHGESWGVGAGIQDDVWHFIYGQEESRTTTAAFGEWEKSKSEAIKKLKEAGCKC